MSAILEHNEFRVLDPALERIGEAGGGHGVVAAECHLRRRSDLSELGIENCAHAPIYESVSEFNEKTLAFLNRRTA